MSRSPTPMASAPPEPPSPVTVTMIGVLTAKLVGTDVGLYVSLDRGGAWQRFMNGFPTVPVP